MNSHKNKSPNHLIHESSPYLLQHAYNPVEWFPFSESVFEKAKRENKPILISIGYSACHWCHVMEHESFEDEEVAGLMNKYFVNVKVDREERSDVDMLYMQAVQLMTGHGGWPLNCFVMPDGRPFYGGTYFRKDQWLNVLPKLHSLFTNERSKVEEYAKELTQGIIKTELISTAKKNESAIDKNVLKNSVKKWKQGFDTVYGGPNRAPKFPLPSNYSFLLRYALLENDKEVLNQVNLTLTKMAMGGIYDQLRGGFSRYSTDLMWKVPHFEKMLYDNAQLVSLYCEAYDLTKSNLYKEMVVDTLKFVCNEWYNSKGYFYSALDADSDGEEGKYYVWTETDLKELLKEDFKLFSRYFEINETGYWEHDNYILMRKEDSFKLHSEFNLTEEEIQQKIKSCKEILIQESKSRIKPALDDKCITAWNAMMCKGFAKAYLSFGNQEYKLIAIQSIDFILENLIDGENKIFRTYKNGIVKITGFLDDYAFVIEALIDCYIISVEEKYLVKAKELLEYALIHFENKQSEMLFYTSDKEKTLVARTSEISDNVTPASNSQTANNLWKLGIYFGNNEWIEKSKRMLNCVTDEMMHYGSGYSNWANLALHFNFPVKEIAIVGKHVDDLLLPLHQHGILNTIFAVSKTKSELPLLKNRFKENESLIYVCENYECKLPVETVEEAIKLLR